jgi:hypothetical protein
MSTGQGDGAGQPAAPGMIAGGLERPDEDRRIAAIFAEQRNGDSVSYSLTALHYQGELPGDTHALRRPLGRVVVSNGRVSIEQRPDPALLAVGLCLLAAWTLFWISRVIGAGQRATAQE